MSVLFLLDKLNLYKSWNRLKMNMEKLRMVTAMKYYSLYTNRLFVFKGHKKYDGSIILKVTNNGGEISFTFIDLESNQETKLDNPVTGEYTVPIKANNKIKLLIKSSKANGSYKISKKIYFDN